MPKMWISSWIKRTKYVHTQLFQSNSFVDFIYIPWQIFRRSYCRVFVESFNVLTLRNDKPYCCWEFFKLCAHVVWLFCFVHFQQYIFSLLYSWYYSANQQLVHRHQFQMQINVTSSIHRKWITLSLICPFNTHRTRLIYINNNNNKKTETKCQQQLVIFWRITIFDFVLPSLFSLRLFCHLVKGTVFSQNSIKSLHIVNKLQVFQVTISLDLSNFHFLILNTEGKHINRGERKKKHTTRKIHI